MGINIWSDIHMWSRRRGERLRGLVCVCVCQDGAAVSSQPMRQLLFNSPMPVLAYGISDRLLVSSSAYCVARWHYPPNNPVTSVPPWTAHKSSRAADTLWWLLLTAPPAPTHTNTSSSLPLPPRPWMAGWAAASPAPSFITRIHLQMRLWHFNDCRCVMQTACDIFCCFILQRYVLKAVIPRMVTVPGPMSAGT